MYYVRMPKGLLWSMELIIIEFNCSSKLKHVTRNKKRCQMSDIVNQNQTFIILLLFKTIVITTS